MANRREGGLENAVTGKEVESESLRVEIKFEKRNGWRVVDSVNRQRVSSSKSGVQTRYAKGMDVVDSKNNFSDTKDMI